MFDVRITKFPPTAAEIMKQINFGTALGLTNTAIQAQTAVVGAMQGRFTIRNNWLTNSPIGIKINRATKVNLKAEVFTRAPFLPLQESGGIKIPYGNHLAMPADDGPLKKLKKIPEALRPKALMASGRGFIITGKKSGVKLMMTRNLKSRGKYGGVRIMYVLIPHAKLKPANVFYKVIGKVVDRRLALNISQGIEKAFATGGNLRGRIGTYGPK